MPFPHEPYHHLPQCDRDVANYYSKFLKISYDFNPNDRKSDRKTHPSCPRITDGGDKCRAPEENPNIGHCGRAPRSLYSGCRETDYGDKRRME